MAETIQRAIQDACLSTLALMGVALAALGVSAMMRRMFARIRSSGVATLLLLAVASSVMFGGAKTNGLLQSFFPFAPQFQLSPFTSGVVLQGFDPLLATPSPRASADMPFRAANWNRRGAWNDSFRCLFPDGWVFPYGTGRLDRVEVCSQGFVIPRYGSTNVVAGVGVPLEIVNPTTSFGCGPTDRNSYVFAWTNAVIGRVLQECAATAETMDASIELFRNGDVAVTTNGVTELTPRIHPSDIDGDGILDATDPNPGVCDGDFFGPSDELPQGANTNAYCWVDVVVSNADAEVVFTGDGPSNLQDPHFMARAGATNRVTILVGKGYTVSADERIECVGTSDPEIEVERLGETSIFVRRPVTIAFVDGTSPPLRDGSSHGISRMMNVVPDCLSGEFEWTTNHCCAIYMSGLSFAWDCLGQCGCGGCQAVGHYVYEGYWLDALGGSCGCPSSSHTEDPPFLGVSFSEDAVFYEEAYTNQPGDVVERRVSTNATLTCSAYGGQYGGTISVATANLGKFQKTGGDDLPTGPVDVAPYETRTWSAEYAPIDHSDCANDITATATFTETLSGNMMCATASTTIVELKLTPWTTRQGYDNRHLVGVGESVRCVAVPNVGHLGETGGGAIFTDSGENYKCPLTSDGSVLHYDVGNSRYDFDLTIVEPTAMVALSPVAKEFGIATNHAGGAGMNLEIHVLPETVAFDGIAMEEIPSLEGVHQGYFSNIHFRDRWYHTTARGAGKWFDVRNGNFVCNDPAWMGDEMPRELPNGYMTFDMTRGEWSDGLLVWNITWGWAERQRAPGDPPIKAMTVRYDQTFTFDEYGTLTVSKFQNTVSRGTNNVIRLNGDIVTGAPLTEEEINEANGNE